MAAVKPIMHILDLREVRVVAAALGAVLEELLLLELPVPLIVEDRDELRLIDRGHVARVKVDHGLRVVVRHRVADEGAPGAESVVVDDRAVDVIQTVDDQEEDDHARDRVQDPEENRAGDARPRNVLIDPLFLVFHVNGVGDPIGEWHDFGGLCGHYCE